MILTIRTDKPESEIGLYQDGDQIDYVVWAAHRQLAETLHGQIRDLLQKHGQSVHDITGIGCFAGPGSFTGLRIGLSVGNAMAYSLQVPIVAQSGDDWVQRTQDRLAAEDSDTLALPSYGAEVHITHPKQVPSKKD